MSRRELITVALGNYSNLVAAQYFNGTTSYDAEEGIIYMETSRRNYSGHIGHGKGGDTNNDNNNSSIDNNSGVLQMPRMVLLDNQHPSRIIVEYANDGEGSPVTYPTKYNYHQKQDEDDRAYGARMYACDEDADKDASYGGAAVGVRVRERLKRERELRQHDQQRQNKNNDNSLGGGNRDVKATSSANENNNNNDINCNSDNDDDEDKEVPIFSIHDPLVPWYRYIVPPLHTRSYTLLGATHADPRGTALLHSFGYGMGTISSGNNSGIISQAHNSNSLVSCSEVQEAMDNIRFQLEAADAPQGVQLIVDADGALGGLGVSTIRHIHDDFDSSITVATFAAFAPFPIYTTDDFATQRADEILLNKALATHFLGSESALYVPFNIPDWETMWQCPYTLDNVATAMMMAATIDSAFYSCRDTENRSNTSSYNLTPTKALDPEASYQYIWQHVNSIKPCPSMKLASTFTALPMALKRRAGTSGHGVLDVRCDPQRQPTFAQFLQDHPLARPTANILTTLATTNSNNNSASVLPTTYVPLTHSITHGATTAAGRIHGQSVSLRGVGGLEDKEYPRNESLLRLYMYETRCSRMLTTVTDKGYTISSTFPSVLLGLSTSSSTTTAVPDCIKHVPMGTHIATTSSATAMIKSIISGATPIIQTKLRRGGGGSALADSYGLEGDEWGEVVEGLHQIRDDYDHDEEREDDEENPPK